ncbi:MAG: effector-associated constant component EACC1 [Solirubrobacteraceae bacterium]
MRLEVGLESDADAAELQVATSQLRSELLELDVDDVQAPSSGAAPPGVRGVATGEIGTLLVAAGRAAIGPIVAAIQSWVARRASRSVKLTIDGDSIEVSNVSPEDQHELIESFLARHAPDSP